MSGYDPDFLDGVHLPLPVFRPEIAGEVLAAPDLRAGVYADYIHYTVVTSRAWRAPLFAALNIDQNLIVSTQRDDRWLTDSRIGAEFQLDNAYYENNPWDRGHLARRASASWGENPRAARKASDDTFYYSNASLQHANFNRDEWLGLEDWVLDLDLDRDGRITSFSGPVWGDFGRSIRPVGRPAALVPAGFFKVVCFVNRAGSLDVRAFYILQDEAALSDRRGRRRYDNQTYQVTITEIEELTGLDFEDSVYDANPLMYGGEGVAERLGVSSLPERIEVDRPEDIADADTERVFVADDDVDVYIAAAMIDAAGADRSGEWVSLLNLSGETIDLSAWTISDTRRPPLVLGERLTEAECLLAPGEARVVKPVSPLELGNRGGVIALFDDRGRRIDRLRYTEAEVPTAGRPLAFVGSFSDTAGH